MIAHYVCNTLYLPLSLFLYPFYIEYKGSFVSTTGRRRRLGRPHKLYIFIISINNRVDIAMSIYAFVCMKLEISEQYRVYYSRVHSTVAFLLVLSLCLFLSLFSSFSLFLSPVGHLQLASCHGCRCCVLQNPTASLQTWRLSDCHKLCSNFCMSSYALFLPASPRLASLPHLALASPAASQCEKCASRSAFGDSKRSKRIYLAAAFSASIRLG